MIRFGACLLFILTLGACAEVGNLSTPAQDREAGPYLAVARAWTRNASVYKGLDSELLVDATFRSLPFRMAYAAEHARIYLLDREATEKLVKDQVAAHGTYLDFTVAAYVPRMEGGDFTGQSPLWRAYLENDKAIRAEPLEIRSLSQDKEVARHFFPYLTPWKWAYTFRFPHADARAGQPLLDRDTRWLSLVITGPSGSARMTWQRPETGWEPLLPQGGTPPEGLHR